MHSAWLAEKRQNQFDLTIVSSPRKRVNMMHVIIFENNILNTTELQKPGDAHITERHSTAPQLNNNFTTMLTAVSPNRLTEYTLYKVMTHPEIPPYYKDFKSRWYRAPLQESQIHCVTNTRRLHPSGTSKILPFL